jgi:chlorite dismutase
MPKNELNLKKSELTDPGLRLVDEAPSPQPFPVIDRQFVNYGFLRIDPEWRRLDEESKAILKDEFVSIYEIYRKDLLMFSYSLVGFDSKAELMLWRIGNSLDLMQEMTSRLHRSGLGRYLETADNYLAITKRMMFVTNEIEDRYHINAGSKPYHFLYPCTMQKQWYAVPAEDRDKMIEENFMVGKRFPNIKIHMTYSFGFSDRDYLISFEADDPHDFLALAEELKETTASKYTVQGLPVYTCRQRPLLECLDALG